MKSLETDKDGSLKTNFTLKDQNNIYQLQLGQFDPSRSSEHEFFSNQRSTNYLRTTHLNQVGFIPISPFVQNQKEELINLNPLQNLLYIPLMSPTQNYAPKIPSDPINQSLQINSFSNIDTNKSDSELNSINTRFNEINSYFTLPDLVKNESNYHDPLAQFPSLYKELELPFQWQSSQWWKDHIKESHEQQIEMCQKQMETRSEMPIDDHSAQEAADYIQKFHQYIQKMYEFQVLHPNEFEEYMKTHPEEYTQYMEFFDYMKSNFSHKTPPSFDVVHSTSIDFFDSVPIQRNNSNPLYFINS